MSPCYEYKCSSCNAKLEIVHSIKDSPRKKCPKCKRRKLQLLPSRNVSVIFKGDGFYRSIAYINQKAKEGNGGGIHDGEPGSISRGDGE